VTANVNVETCFNNPKDKPESIVEVQNFDENNAMGSWFLSSTWIDL